MNTTIDHEFLTEQQVAARLGCSPDTVKRLARRGAFPRYKISPGVVRYDPREVNAYVERTRSEGGAA